jgi:hypothetical protein
VIERYDDGLARYDQVINHREADVYYILTPEGARSPGVQTTFAAGTQLLERLEPVPVLALADAWAADGSGYDAVIEMSEWGLETAAEIRARHGVPGMLPTPTIAVRDKVAMKTAADRAGLSVPKFRPVNDIVGVEAAVAELGFPLFAKPRRLAASRGARPLLCQAALEGAGGLDWADYEVEEYIPGSIYHVDGLVLGGRLPICVPSRYLGSCYGFSRGEMLGSVREDDPIRVEEICKFTARAIAALGIDDSAFHLELIVADGSAGRRPSGELVFLEVGARVGGGAIPFLFREVYGLNLIDEWLRVQLGQVRNIASPASELVGGFLMVPEPHVVPCRVRSVRPLGGLVEGLVAENVPATGKILDGCGGYEHISGTMLFRGSTSREVERSIRKAASLFSIITEPVN